MTDETKVETPDVKTVIAEALAPVLKELEALKAVPAPVQEKQEIPKELSELPELIRALTERVAALEKTPAPVTTLVPEVSQKELEEPVYFVRMNKKTGTIG